MGLLIQNGEIVTATDRYKADIWCEGAIQVGSDADLVVYDPAYRGKISAATQSMNVDYSAFEGWDLEGRPSVVTVRGEVAVRDGKFVGQQGRGRFLSRPTTHF